MQYLLELVKLGAATTLLDVDNALYMTAAIEPLPPEKQKKAIFWGLLLEFSARILLVLVFGFLASGTEPLFKIFGIEFTAETISLLAAGIFLSFAAPGNCSIFSSAAKRVNHPRTRSRPRVSPGCWLK
jgi:predicted tellurium resistance membrane protein TerC